MTGARPSLSEPLELVALDPARNIRRRYTITVSVDLFGAFIVETRWGRIGSRGQVRKLSFEDRGAADRHVAATLRRRGTSERRIGGAYRAQSSIEGSPRPSRPIASDNPA